MPETLWRRGRVVEALAELWWARLRIAMLKSPDLVNIFCAPVPDRVNEADRVTQAAYIGCAIFSASHYCGFASTCLQRAYAARRMLRRRGMACTLHFAVAPAADATLASHVWLSSRGIAVTGLRALSNATVMQTAYGLSEGP